MSRNINNVLAGQPSISVIIPLYKVERYISYCVESVLCQTFQDFEIIIVDDASPDSSYELCQKLYGENSIVKVLRQEKNSGAGPARNAGLKVARGKYIYFMDGDDELLPYALEYLYNLAEKYDADVVHTLTYFICAGEGEMKSQRDSWKIYKKETMEEGKLVDDKDVCLRWQIFNTMQMPWLYLYRRSFLCKNHIYFPAMLSEDDIFNVQVVLYAKKYITMGRCLSIYRQQPESTTHSITINRMDKTVHCMVQGTIEFQRIWRQFTDKLSFETRKLVLTEWLRARIVLAQGIFGADRKGGLELDAALGKSLKAYFGDNEFLVRTILQLVNRNSMSLNKLKFMQMKMQQEEVALNES